MRLRVVVLALAFPVAFAVSTAAPLPAQELALTGKVTSAEDGQPLAGAIVSIPSLDVDTTSDAEGTYRLPLPAAAQGTTVEVRASLPPFQGATAQVGSGRGRRTTSPSPCP